MRKYTSEIAQKFLNEINSGSSIAELQAIKWSTIDGKIKELQKYIDITEEEAKKEIKRYLIK